MGGVWEALPPQPKIGGGLRGGAPKPKLEVKLIFFTFQEVKLLITKLGR